MTTNRDWQLFIEAISDGTGGFFATDCTDIGQINTNIGTIQTAYERNQMTGFYCEIEEVRGEPGFTTLLQLPEDEADNLRDLYMQGCVTALQRRHCDGRVEHFHRLILNGETQSSPTATGLATAEGVSVISLPVKFSKRTRINKNTLVKIAENPLDLPGVQTLFDVTYCDCPSCDSSSCAVIYRLWLNALSPFLYLEYSEDNGETWTEIDTSVFGVINTQPQSMNCYNGRLQVGIARTVLPDAVAPEIWRMDRPHCGTFVADTPEVLQIATLGFVPGDWVAIESEGLRLYALNHKDGDTICYRSIMGQDYYEVVLVIQDTLLSHIAAAGNGVIVGGTGGEYWWSTEGGDLGSWVQSTITTTASDISALDIYTPDSLRPSTIVAVFATENNQIIKAVLPSTKWNRATIDTTSATIQVCEDVEEILVYDLCSTIGVDNGSVVSLVSILDGRGLWWGRTINGVYRYLYDWGGSCSIGIAEFPTNNDTTIEDNARLIVCPEQPDTVTVHGWFS